MSGSSFAPPGEPGSPGTRLLGLEGKTLVLASSSPRRVDLLRGLGISFRTRAVSVDERLLPGESSEEACVRLAQAKVRAATQPEDEATFVLGADTLVVLEGLALGKPESAADAMRMLRRLSGRAHEVWTGLALHRTSDGATFTGAERTEVRFGDLSEEAILILVASGEPMDKAGAYGIQGLAGLFIDRIEGDYYNVLGLPLARLRRLIRDAS